MTRRMTKTDWLDFGLQRLAHHGVEALKVAKLCDAAGKTIGSFYHHFEDQPAFFDALLAHWKQRNTTEVLNRLNPSTDTGIRAQHLEQIAQRMNSAEEVGIRAFAAQNTAAMEVVKEVDALRIRFLQSLYEARFELDTEQANALARLEYAAFVGAQTIWPNAKVDEGQKLSGLFQTMVAAQFGQSSD